MHLRRCHERGRICRRIKPIRVGLERGACIGCRLANTWERDGRRQFLTEQERTVLRLVFHIVKARRHQVRAHRRIRNNEVIKDDDAVIIARRTLGLNRVAHDAEANTRTPIKRHGNAIKVLVRAAICNCENNDIR